MRILQQSSALKSFLPAPSRPSQLGDEGVATKGAEQCSTISDMAHNDWALGQPLTDTCCLPLTRGEDAWGLIFDVHLLEMLFRRY